MSRGRQLITGGIQKSFTSYMRDVLKESKNIASREIKYGDPQDYIRRYGLVLPRKTGKGRWRANIFNTHPMSRMLEFTGAKPHVIVGNPFLAFRLRSGQLIITRLVHHTGFTARNFVIRAVHITQPKFQGKMSKFIRNVPV